MKQRTRIIIAFAILTVVAGIVLTVDFMQRRQSSVAEPGSIPVYVEGILTAYITPSKLSLLEKTSFKDTEEGKTQEGWLLRDVLYLALNVDTLTSDSVITISSSSRDKSVSIPWTDVAISANMVLFDLSGRDTLKLVSEKLPYLDVRDEWIQDVDKIEVW